MTGDSDPEDDEASPDAVTGLLSDAESAWKGARLMAIQALYQMDVAGTPLSRVLRDFTEHWRFDPPSVGGVSISDAAVDRFEIILRSAVEHRTAVDRVIDGCLVESWRFDRIDSILRAILRCGVNELMDAERRLPARVMVGRYADLAHAFLDDAGGGMANAVLDRVARSLDSPTPSP